MKYAVQYAYDNGIHTRELSMSNVHIVEDTLPIEYAEAINIFNSHLDDFRKRLKNEEQPNLVIWEDVGDGEYPVYSKELINLAWDDLEISGDTFIRTTKTRVQLPK